MILYWVLPVTDCHVSVGADEIVTPLDGLIKTGESKANKELVLVRNIITISKSARSTI